MDGERAVVRGSGDQCGGAQPRASVWGRTAPCRCLGGHGPFGAHRMCGSGHRSGWCWQRSAHEVCVGACPYVCARVCVLARPPNRRSPPQSLQWTLLHSFCTQRGGGGQSEDDAWHPRPKPTDTEGPWAMRRFMPLALVQLRFKRVIEPQARERIVEEEERYAPPSPSTGGLCRGLG